MPAILRSLSTQGLKNLRQTYVERTKGVGGAWMRQFLTTRVSLIDAELEEREDADDVGS